MKLQQQKVLYFSEGKSDKVYEVSLFDIGDDSFVVNFKYGRRGSVLREGTKTVFPVDYDEAIQIFEKLVESKEKKGYSETQNTVVEEKEEAPVFIKKSPNILSEREETILKYLKQGSLGTYTRNWKMSRVIWRAGQLKIAQAAPLLKHFFQSNDEFEQYAAIYSMAQIGDSMALAEAATILDKEQFETKTGRVAAAYLLKAGDSQAKAKVKNLALLLMPSSWKTVLGEKDSLVKSMALYFLQEKIDASALFCAYMYSFDNDLVRSAVYDVLQLLLLKVHTFKSFRYIFRASEILEDISINALIAKRIVVSKPGYESYFVMVEGRYVNALDEKQKKNPSIAFSGKTKQYFNRAIYRNVREWSRERPETYINFATELMCVLDDDTDNMGERKKGIHLYVDQEWKLERRLYPKYSRFLSLMYIVHGNSEKLKSINGQIYYLEDDMPAENSREEHLAELWNKHPQQVLKILAKSKSDFGVDFSLRIIREQKHFLELASKELLIQLIGHRKENVVELILGEVRRRYLLEKPEPEVVVALLSAPNEKARNLGMEWLQANEPLYMGNPNFIGGLLLSKNPELIDYLETLYGQTVRYKTQLEIAQLEPFFVIPVEFDIDYLQKVNHLIGETYFGELLRLTPREKIEWLASSTNTNKLFAINLAKHNQVPVFELFRNSYDEYINSEDPILRKAGIEVLSHFPDEFLLENHYQIGQYCFSEYAEVREAIVPTVKRLAQLDQSFKESLKKQLLQSLSEPETFDGLHQSSYELLTTIYGSDIESVTDREVIDLVVSDYEFAQKLGTPMLMERVDFSKLLVGELVLLSRSPVLAVRERLHAYFNENVARVNYELESALRVFNSEWPDVIDWGCTYFGEHIEARNWTLELLLYVSDHVNEKVQSFGRQMITTHFLEEKGLELMLKLQEHPTKSMQFFVTNYLDKYAKNQPNVILKLEDYFRTVLFYTNESRAAKTRIYAFLAQESVKEESVARMAIRIVDSILGTKTKRDISQNIDLLLGIHEAFPDLEIPILVKSNSEKNS